MTAAATSVMIVKAQIDGDMRRFNVELPEDADATESLQAIHTAVAQAFDMEAASLPALKYQDPEGDMCTLVAASLDDMLELNNRGTLRLFASKSGPAVAEAAAPSISTSKSRVLTVEKTAEVSIVPDEVVAPAEAASSTWVSGQSADEEVVQSAPPAIQEDTLPAPQAKLPPQDVFTADELPPQEERPEQWGHELPEDPIEAVKESPPKQQSPPPTILAASPKFRLRPSNAAKAKFWLQQQPEGLVELRLAEASDEEAGKESQEEPEQLTQEQQQEQNTEEPEEQTQGAPQEPNAESTDDTEEVAMLMAMGFSRDQALQALQDAHGNVELAVEYLLNGRRAPGTPLEKLERKVRALPGNVTEQLRKLQTQLREVVANMQQHRVRMQERFQASRTQAQESEHMESLQAALEEIKGRLREFRQMAQAALKKASGSVPDAQEQEQLEKVEAQLAEAQRFVSETLATLHARGSEVLQSATPNTAEAASSEIPEASEGAADGADIASVVMETIDAAATAAVDAAEVAMATVDEMLFPEDDAAPDAASSFPPAGYTPEAAPEAPRPSIAKATVMDHAQVFLSKSISAIRSQASALRQPNRNDNWVEVPLGTFAPAAAEATAEAAAAEAADTSLLQSALHPVGEGELEGAHAVPAPTFQGRPDNASLDEFLLVTAVTDAATPETQDNASLMHDA